jgi:tripartite-type tricarboxylate transporter receptor subunit TctC
MSPRRLVSGLFLGLASVALCGSAVAQGAADWPNKTVRVIVNYGPGGAVDNSMRPFAQRLSAKLGHQFVIENRGGASGALGVEAAMKSTPDGYTFLVTPAPTMCILPHLRKTPFDPLKDLVSVSQITGGTQLIAVHPSIPSSNMSEFVDYLKRNPGKLSWGSAGVGTFGHIMGEILKIEAGVCHARVFDRFLCGVGHARVRHARFDRLLAGATANQQERKESSHSSRLALHGNTLWMTAGACCFTTT